MRHQLNRTAAAGKGRRACRAGCLLAALAVLLAAGPASAGQRVFQPLAAYLEGQGMPPAKVERLLNSRRLKFQGRILARFLARPEKSLDYAQFLSPTVVRRARRFKHRHAALLRANRAATQVPGPVVVAILAVESSLGSYTGRWNTMSVLASQAVLDTELGRRLLYRHWPRKQRRYFHSPEFEERLARRAAWARQEVVALLRLASRRRISPYDFKGSPAGALGMCQFMPSSALDHGVDGNRDGRLDLNHPADAVHSVGRYLHAHGWRPGLTRRQQLQVLLTYNHSQPYANTVLELARRLR